MIIDWATVIYKLRLNKCLRSQTLLTGIPYAIGGCQLWILHCHRNCFALLSSLIYRFVGLKAVVQLLHSGFKDNCYALKGFGGAVLKLLLGLESLSHMWSFAKEIMDDVMMPCLVV